MIANPDDFPTTGVERGDIVEEGWEMVLAEPGARLGVPGISHNAMLAPFMQVRWKAENYPETARPFLEWTSEEMPDFARGRRMYFDPPASEKMVYSMVPMYRHPEWRDQTITGIRLGFDNATTGSRVILQGIFPQFDTRHNVNNPAYVTACIDYFFWTGDLNFLRANIERMRLAMGFMEMEFGTDEDGLVKMPWVGHEGTTGLILDEEGNVTMRGGHGVGNNYWDLVPFGQTDSYATIRHFHAARRMAELEREIEGRPEWNIAPSPLLRTAEHWERQAEMAKENGNQLFWNEETGRFTLGPDSEGNQADYGFTFLNLEAIAYGFATEERARSIMDWLDGRREVADDTSQTTDIYVWRFAPRATTKRNIEHYGWFWNGPHHIAFGDQVQDGGAVLGFSYHDILARLRVNGAEDAGRRLMEIARWYGEVVEAGGYRAYYDGSRPGNLQGGGTPGGLGLDKEFFESVMVPHVLLDGFAGLRPTADGFSLNPMVPESWGELGVTNIAVRGNVFDLKVSADGMTLTPRKKRPGGEPLMVSVPERWSLVEGGSADGGRYSDGEGLFFAWDVEGAIRFIRGD